MKTGGKRCYKNSYIRAMHRQFLALLLFSLFGLFCRAQQAASSFSRADTLRGSITPERAWWDVLSYDISIKPDFIRLTTTGSNVITYKVLQSKHPAMQLDLQDTLHIDSIFFNQSQKLRFTKDGSAWHVQVPQQTRGAINRITVYFSGKPRTARRPPWEGGWSFLKDSLGRPWMTVTCQGTGASVWYPCKDHQSDEPDKGASLSMRVPDTLMAVANGRLQSSKNNNDGTVTYKWAVVSPINNYDIIPYIGKYVNFGETYNGLKGKLDLNYWVLDYNLPRAKDYMPPEVHNMLKAFEYWFGPYPFYEDGYKLVDVQHPGMEHQSAVAYGNRYKAGYWGRDASGTGLGFKWDFIIVHESGHEWFGNNITTKDLADMWVHEGFTNYSETLFVDYRFGKEAGNDYNYGIRRGIRNDKPIIAHYGVNEEGSGDMYPKGGNLLHTLRHSIDNDELFRSILTGLNKDFFHQTVTSAQVEHYFSAKAGYDYSRVFDQYLRSIQIPTLEFYRSGNKLFYRWTNCVPGFTLPLVLKTSRASLRILPSEKWQNTALKAGEEDLFQPAAIEKMYYIKARAVR